MSPRQPTRADETIRQTLDDLGLSVQGDQGLVGHRRNMDSESEDEVAATSPFATLEDSDEEEEEEKVVKDAEKKAPQRRKKKKKPQKKKKVPVDDADDDELLAAALVRQRVEEKPKTRVLAFHVGRVDADREMASKLGVPARSRRAGKRRGVFPESFDGEFGEPPSFASGGMRWDGEQAVGSDDWTEGDAALKACVGDPNELASLCAMRPFHAPALVATATAVCALGKSNLAEPLCKRALRAYTMGDRLRTKVMDGTFRASYESARPLFDAAFLLARLSGMRGATETSANLFKFVLSLDSSDPKGVLMRPFFDEALDVYDAHPLIPTTCVARALSLAGKEQREQAIEATVDALVKFPHLLLCLVNAMDMQQSSFREPLWHDHFSRATWTTGQRAAYAAGGLPRALDAVCLTTRHAWKGHVDVLLAAANRVASKDASQWSATVAEVDRAWAEPPLSNYAKCPIEDFANKFELLSPEVAADFDDRLLTPQAAKEHAHRRPRGGGRQHRMDEDEMLVMDLIAQLPPELQTQYEAQLRAGASPLEVQAMLLQLF